jgi:hypothetical protein
MPTPITISPWPARLAYAAALLAVVWFFQHKMAEQARWHRMLTAVAAPAVEAVDEGSGDTYREISSQVNSYPNPYMVNHLRKAQAVLRETRSSLKALDGLHKKSFRGQTTVFQQQIASMAILADSLLTYCDSDSEIQINLQEMIPVYSDTLQRQLVAHFSRAGHEDAKRWGDILRLRYTLASDASLEYSVKSVTPDCSMRFGPYPEWRGLQTCPVAGDVFRADIFVGGYGYGPFPDYSIEINGASCGFEAGKWTYKHRFDTPGVHQLNVQTRVFDAWDSTLIQAYSRTFEVRVLPNHDLSTPKI